MTIPPKRNAPILLPDAEGLSRRRGRLFARAPREPLQVANYAGATTLKLYGAIGEGGITAADFAEKLAAIPGDFVLRVHSPGGDPLAAIAMFNDMLAHPGRIEVQVPSLAASAASILIMAGDRIRIAENAHVMIHNVWSLAIGDKHAHRQEADVLNAIDQALIVTYAQRTGLAPRAISDMLDAETWMLGNEAVRLKFADEILQPNASDTTARFDLSVYQNVPAALATLPPRDNAKIESRAELQALLRDRLNLANGAAKKIADAAWPVLAGREQSEIEDLSKRMTAAAAELSARR